MASSKRIPLIFVVFLCFLSLFFAFVCAFACFLFFFYIKKHFQQPAISRSENANEPTPLLAFRVFIVNRARVARYARVTWIHRRKVLFAVKREKE